MQSNAAAAMEPHMTWFLEKIILEGVRKMGGNRQKLSWYMSSDQLKEKWQTLVIFNFALKNGKLRKAFDAHLVVEGMYAHSTIISVYDNKTFD